MKKSVLTIAMVFALAASMLMVGCSGTSTKKADGDTIRIGQLAALTGGSAPYGIPENNAVKMAVDEINAAGGVMGKQLELICYDTKGDQTETINCTKRLIGDGVCCIIGPSQSGAAIAIGPVTKEAGVPFMATAATNVNVTIDSETGDVLKTGFRAGFIDPFQGKVAAQFALKDLGVTKAAVVYDIGSDYAQGLAQYFKEAFVAAGGEIVSDEAYMSGELDFRAILGKVKNTDPEIIFNPGLPTEGALIMQQGHELGLDCYYIGGDNWSSEDLLKIGGEDVEGGYLINLTSKEAVTEWWDKYVETFKEEPILPAPIMAVDALKAICNAIETGKSAAPEDIIANLEKTSGLEVLSGQLTIDPATHNPMNKPAVILTVKDGEIVFLKTFETTD